MLAFCDRWMDADGRTYQLDDEAVARIRDSMKDMCRLGVLGEGLSGIIAATTISFYRCQIDVFLVV